MMPNAFQSIRFRLSLAISLVVFSVGTLVVGGLYLWQVNSIDEPTINVQEFSIVDSRGQQFDGSVVVP